MSQKSVLITGCGIVSAIGQNCGQVLDSLKESPIQKECDAKIDQTLAEIQQILGIEIKGRKK